MTTYNAHITFYYPNNDRQNYFGKGFMVQDEENFYAVMKCDEYYYAYLFNEKDIRADIDGTALVDIDGECVITIHLEEKADIDLDGMQLLMLATFYQTDALDKILSQ